MTAGRPWRAFLGAFWPFLLGCVLVAGGFGAIVIGYFGVSGTVLVGLQVPYLVSGAVLGLALVILGSSLIVVQVLTRQARLLRRMLAEVQPETLEEAAEGTRGVLLAVAGGRSFHRAGCILVEGKAVHPVTADETRSRGLDPCRLCDPVLPSRTGA